ncbi:TorD/DmsD family molecular chaperone [Desulfobacterota bacterium M19]
MSSQHPFFFLSAAFTYPEQVNIQPLFEVLDSLSADLGIEFNHQDTENNISLTDLQAEYVRLFINSPAGIQAPPYASIYIGNRGILLQQGHDEAMSFYQAAGLETIESTECEDHIAFELAFIGHLIEDNRLDLLREFIHEHVIKWYPEFFQRLQSAQPGPFYKILGQVTGLCLKHILIEEKADDE